MRISDWSSDVCSSDLEVFERGEFMLLGTGERQGPVQCLFQRARKRCHTLYASLDRVADTQKDTLPGRLIAFHGALQRMLVLPCEIDHLGDRKSTRLNSSH